MESIGSPKYVTFKREEFDQVMKGQDFLIKQLRSMVLKDAVVIRRQDFFASPALATYAQCIALVAKTTDDKELKERLLTVADFFQQQSELAADEGWKFPGD